MRDGAALLVLEHAARRREELRLRDALKRRYLGRDAPDDIAPALQALRTWLGDTGFVSRPSELLPDGYGLPQSEERVRVAKEAQLRVARLREQDGALREDLERWLPADQRDVLSVSRVVNLGNARSRATPNGMPDRTARTLLDNAAIAAPDLSSTLDDLQSRGLPVRLVWRWQSP